VWDFAVEIHVLRASGLTHSDLRWLVCRDLVEHAAEITRDGQDRRVFRRTGHLTFAKRTCFVLAEAAVEAPPSAPEECPAAAKAATLAAAGPPPLPQWDKERQELRLGQLVVKQSKVPAPNQEMILASFQEGWPPRIDDPLPPQADQDSKRRLHDTIITLNRASEKSPHPLFRRRARECAGIRAVRSRSATARPDFIYIRSTPSLRYRREARLAMLDSLSGRGFLL
jgi:hypothetical protein